MQFSDFIGLMEEERAKEARKILDQRGFDEEETRAALDEIYGGGTPKGFAEEEALLFTTACLYSPRMHEREQALLSLYYRVAERGYEEERGFLRDYAGEAENEADEKLRGRKHWVRLRLLFDEGTPHDDVESYVRSMGERERSSWVWERVIAVLQGWSESFRLYPELETWNIPLERGGEPYWALVRRTVKRHATALDADRTVRDGLAEWTAAAMGGEFPYERLSWIYENYGSAGADFPLSAETFRGLCSGQAAGHLTGLDAQDGRMILLSYLGCYISEGGWNGSRACREVLEELMDRSYAPEADVYVYERAVALLLKGYMFLRGERPDPPFGEIVDFLHIPFPPEYARPEVYHAVAGAMTPLLLRFLVDRSVSSDEAVRGAELLWHGSNYLKMSGATLLLQAVRSGYDIAPVLSSLKAVIAENPDSSNALASGKDIEDEEYEISFDFPSPKGFFRDEGGEESADKKEPAGSEVGGSGGAESEGGEGAQAEEEFFSLGNLTGLLEACRPPVTSFRLALALREYAEMVGDREMQSFLSGFSDVNAALDDLDGLDGLNSGDDSGPGRSGEREAAGDSSAGGAAPSPALEPEPADEDSAGERKRSEPYVNKPDVKEGAEFEKALENRESRSTGVPERQVGPLYLPEILDMVEKAVEGASNRQEAREAAERAAAKKAGELERRYGPRLREEKRGLIRGVFGGDAGSKAGASAGVAGVVGGAVSKDSAGESGNSAGQELFLSIFDRLRSMGAAALAFCEETKYVHFAEEAIGEGALHPDLLAVYRPYYESGGSGEYRYGVYFFINRIIDLVFAMGVHSVSVPLVRTVAVHELFHAHMNEMLPDRGRNHDHRGENPPYCRLEEASANRVAFDYLETSAAGYENDDEIRRALTDSLFVPRENSGREGRGKSGRRGRGLPGYGEYDKVDADGPRILPEMIADAPHHPEVDEYAARKALYSRKFSPRRRNAAVWWHWLLDQIDSGAVPMYFDIECGRR